jgi:hypothetical protein
MKIGAAQRLIRDSSWWIDHPQGPVRAPGNHERVTFGIHGWEIELGSNKFLVGKALKVCLGTIYMALNEAEKSGMRIEWASLREKLIAFVRGSVVNYNGDEYFSYGTSSDPHMKFGAHSINVEDFVNCIYELGELHRVCR